jgi:hypothetical protein
MFRFLFATIIFSLLGSLCQTFAIFPASTPIDDPLEKRRGLAATAAPVAFVEGIGQQVKYPAMRNRRS